MERELEGKLRRTSDEHGRRHKRFQAMYRERCDRLLETLLPRLDAEALARLSQVGLSFSDDLLSMMEKDRQRCLDELADLTRQFGDELDPDSSEPFGELDKLEEHLCALQPFLKTCFQHPRFEKLLLEGYGTEEYPKRFWHLSYYIDRRAAQEIEELCGGRSFESIRREAIQALEASQVLKQRIETLKQRRRETAGAAGQKRTLEERLSKHPQLWLSLARRRLLESLEADPAGAFEKCRTLAAEESFAWRFSKELCKEHWDLETRLLKPAREALKNGLKGTCRKLLEEYESLAGAIRRFDQPAADKESIDWSALIYRGHEPSA